MIRWAGAAVHRHDHWRFRVESGSEAEAGSVRKRHRTVPLLEGTMIMARQRAETTLHRPMQRPHDRLLERIQGGDRGAFQELYEQLGPSVHGYLTRMLGESQAAQEVLQEVFLTVWRRCGGFDPRRAGAKTWVFAIARNSAIDRLRRLKVRRADPLDPRWVPDVVGPVEIIQGAQDAERVQAALKELPDAQQDVLRRCFFDFQSYPEIASDLDVALGTVKSRARLGFQRLRHLLEEN